MAISSWGWFVIVLVPIIFVGAAAYVFYARHRARKLGLPPPNFTAWWKRRRDNADYRAPAPAPGGVQGWIADKWSSLTSGRTAGGAYESTGYGGGRDGRRGFGPLDPDEVWDDRVEAGGYNEERELGLQDRGHGPYGGGGYGGETGYEAERGRSLSRQREDDRYDDGLHANPFGDGAAASLRIVSPRPDAVPDLGGAPSHQRGQSSLGTIGSDESPTESRKSMFREEGV